MPGVPYEFLLALRCVAGVGIALVYPPSVKLLATWYPLNRRGGAIAVLFTFFTLGSKSPGQDCDFD